MEKQSKTFFDEDAVLNNYLGLSRKFALDHGLTISFEGLYRASKPGLMSMYPFVIAHRKSEIECLRTGDLSGGMIEVPYIFEVRGKVIRDRANFMIFPSLSVISILANKRPAIFEASSEDSIRYTGSWRFLDSNSSGIEGRTFEMIRVFGIQ